jgi:hypothetical protein
VPIIPEAQLMRQHQFFNFLSFSLFFRHALFKAFNVPLPVRAGFK